MMWLIVVLLFVIATALIEIATSLEKPRAEWKNGKWNGVQD